MVVCLFVFVIVFVFVFVIVCWVGTESADGWNVLMHGMNRTLV